MMDGLSPEAVFPVTDSTEMVRLSCILLILKEGKIWLQFSLFSGKLRVRKEKEKFSAPPKFPE